MPRKKIEGDDGISGSATWTLQGTTRVSGPGKAPKLSKAEVERAEFGLKVLYDDDGTQEEYAVPYFPLTEVSLRSAFSYGYDATHSSSPLSHVYLHGYAEKLVEALTRKRRATKVEPRSSACITGVRDAEVIATSSFYSNMVKFRGADDEGFMAMTEILEIMRQEAKQRRPWLVDKHNQKWLFIIDSYDDLENVDIADFLLTRSGSVTTTNRAPNSRRLGEGLEVEVVPLEDGIEILQKSGGTKMEELDKGM
ncbi:hypothetical protein Q9L58_009434 [Maublancomyces gigas]|uniref:Uncharacterized protein n=1 Tax=Discina gigas TaxID=1032678 RepID=A0ABR3G7E2_9PEZI